MILGNFDGCIKKVKCLLHKKCLKHVCSVLETSTIVTNFGSYVYLLRNSRVLKTSSSVNTEVIKLAYIRELPYYQYPALNSVRSCIEGGPSLYNF